MADLNRRDFLAAAAAMATTCALCGAVASADDDEKAKWQASNDLAPEKFDAGKIDDYAKDAGSDKFYQNHQVLMSRKDGKIIALTAVCTHKKALVKLADNGQFECPRHGSRFTLEGVPALKPNGRMGPAHTPLVHYAITIDDKNHIMVDTGTSFEKDKWGDAGASIDVKGK